MTQQQWPTWWWWQLNQSLVSGGSGTALLPEIPTQDVPGPVAYVMRDGKPLYRILDFISMGLDRRINSVDELNIDLTPDYQIQNYDEIGLIVQNQPIGIFIVTSVEPSEAENGNVTLRITAHPGAGYVLDATANPGPRYFKDVSLQQSFSLITDLVEKQHEGMYHIAFQEVNPNTLVAPYVKKPPATPAQQQVIRRIETQTAISALHDLCVIADARWRCRPDLLVGENNDTFVMEVGLFSEPKAARVLSARGAETLEIAANAHYYSRASRLSKVDDVVTDAFANGSNWMDNQSKEQELAFDGTGSVPLGYTMKTIMFNTGQTAVALSKDLDKNGKPFERRRWKRIVVPGVQPPSALVWGATNPDLGPYMQSLINAVVGYLEVYSEPLETWSITMLDSLLDDGVFPGDRIYAELTNDNCAFRGWMYVIAERIAWNPAGQMTSALELSNRLDSLTSPMDENYKSVLGALHIMQEVLLPPTP